ncbi:MULTISPECIES: hypothetical protein [unclassified Chelatococcus]|uniref:hypothetical protein n=1 Tax=unclassified Chelatococcus TaxID=2638111 RepID=UPI001BCB0749|nr:MULTISPECIES: hypothetical protein [unclassified Chelatococcus]CAH1655556.1 hypothetical protein CHELA20_11285 [Hyphomicrobiales bacterium]MBS7742593.1 hypothetical protein [Chelatococcus sp. HY11]MBX3542289.1 hypothetical protein [Chelatococcus sp.]MCO5075493.1 hypothetical protein [Chelatococcus sp.]CAH1695541.1 hypothetical protein CHELA41_51533 [Hyphomicrobiales bacterium]
MTDTQKQFAEFMTSVLQDEAKLKAFNDSVKDGETLRLYAASNGFDIPEAEAERIFASASEFAASPEAQKLNDDMLEGVAGGMSWAGIGAIAGGVLGSAGLAVGVLSCVAAAPFTGGGSLLGAAALLSGSAAAGLVAGSAAAGAVGAGLGAIGGHLIDESA